jgi:hypothetical protein
VNSAATTAKGAPDTATLSPKGNSAVERWPAPVSGLSLFYDQPTDGNGEGGVGMYIGGGLVALIVIIVLLIWLL